MASSASAGNIACMFENRRDVVNGQNIIGTNNPDPVVDLVSVMFEEFNMEAKSESKEGDYEKEWELLSSTIGLNQSCYIEFVALLAKKTSTDASIYFEVNKDFLKNLEELSPSFYIEGSVSAVRNQHNHIYKPIINLTRPKRAKPFYSSGKGKETYGNNAYPHPERSCTLSYNGVLESGCGVLFREPAPGGLVELMLTRSSEWRFDITWSLSIKWGGKRNLKLGMDNIVAKMYSCEQTKDLTIVVGNGAAVKCHKVIFAAHSSVLAAMISPELGMQEAKSARLELKELSEEGIGFLLPYFYGMNLPISELNCDVTTELFQAAHKYNLSELETELHEFLLEKDADWFTADVLLELYYFSKNVEKLKNLEKHALKVMTRMPDGMKECDRYKELEQAEQLSLMWVLYKSVL